MVAIGNASIIDALIGFDKAGAAKQQIKLYPRHVASCAVHALRRPIAMGDRYRFPEICDRAVPIVPPFTPHTYLQDRREERSVHTSCK